MPSTTNGLPYPVLGGSNNPPADIQSLAESVDNVYGGAVANWAALLALTGNFPGRRVWVTALGGAATYNGTKWIAPEFFVEKTADESVTSSTTMQNDDHLLYAIPGAGTYLIDIYLYASSAANAAGDIGIGATFPAGTFNVGGLGPDVGLASGVVQTGQWNSGSVSSGGLLLQYGLSTARIYIQVHGELVVSAAGTFQFQWAQASSSGSASTVKSGSHMKVKQVA